MTTFANITAKAAVGAGLCLAAAAAVIALSPHAAALPLKTGGYKCVDGAAAPGMPCAAPAVEAAGIAPVAAPAAVPPVPLAPPPIVPPVPLAPPPVPVVPAAAPVPAAPAPIAAPVAVAAGAPSGKGVPTVSPGGGPVAGTPTLPGPADG
ncbi:hypothetical protein [Mycolicibacterium sp.]|uniref:hypothetical protein n=1 Tax=Mycolicibacterium sp. TaxID=2320850 RepID=UPI0037C5B832